MTNNELRMTDKNAVSGQRRFLPYLQLLIFLVLPFLLGGCVWLLVGGAAEGGYVAGKSQSAGQTIRDQDITTSIKTKMIANSDVSARNINVDTDNGIVTLRGTVKTKKEGTIAEKIARTTKGVRKVIYKLEVLPE
jgi:hypothetical protein